MRPGFQWRSLVSIQLQWIVRTVCLLAASAPLFAQAINFLPGTVYPTGNGPLAVATGDFNGDGKPDLVVGNTSSASVTVFLNTSGGNFAPATTVSLPGCVVEFVATGDFNRDGHTDVLAVCALQSTIWVIPGLGTGKFGASISTTVPNIILQGEVEGVFSGLIVGDFNNDGVPDLILGLIDNTFDLGSFSIDLLQGNGDGTFTLSPIIPAGQAQSLPGALMAADFNSDGNMDFAIAGGPVNHGTAQLQTFLGDGQGSFQPGANITLPNGFSAGAGVVTDVNNDGVPDLILVLAAGQQEELTVFSGAGDGTFKQLPAVSQSQPVIGLFAAHLRSAGNVDLLEVLIDKAAGTLTAAASAGNGNGTFQAAIPIAFPAGLQPWPLAVAAGDWNGDGLTDLAFAALPLSFLSSVSSPKNFAGAIQVLQSLPAGDLVVMLNGNAPAPALAVSPTQLQFADVAGGATPAAQTIAISNSGTGTLNWTASSDSSWLAVAPPSGSGPAHLSVSVSPAGLTPGAYTGHVQIVSSGASNSPQNVTVSLAISFPSGTPVITGVVNGASFQPGIESGSWVTIQGSNLSNTNPGRTWTSSEIVNGTLPTALDNTSVTIDGKPAFVYYISPTQLNVQAPGDSATGSVPVVVTNNGERSAVFQAQLQNDSPAMFLYSGTSYAIVSHFPDYALVGNPSVIPGTIAARPGDILILWATGFGATAPATPAGIEVVNASSVAPLPTVTIGGAPVTVLSAVISPGSAGLYQIAIQLPSTVPTGVVTIQASLAGATSPANVLTFVAAQPN
ncbi:MAG TPA: FG-GAP-like repeat-containing protein [Bryobacteraceae bacterium]|nr:FG-GAP-like repeat-containing protein [Bryobacteraceae bacterium]